MQGSYSVPHPPPLLSALHIARLACLAPASAVFLLPGWLLGKIIRSPAPLITAFLGSAALVFNGVLLLGALHLPITLETVGCGLLSTTGVLALWANRRGVLVLPKVPALALPRGTAWLWLVPPSLALVSIAARSLLEPLAGYDNSFRWDYLARMLLERHSLAAYPPVTTADFNAYSWCDGIPPLVPILNFLIYSVAGSVVPRMIGLRAVGEFLLLGAVVWRMARALWGPEAGWPALGALGSCALLIWGVAIEQETALTAISLVSMIYLLGLIGPANDEQSGAKAVWAGIAAGVGAISREYGLYFVLLGGLLLMAQRRTRFWVRFGLPAAVVAAPWYVRNWIKTGNPAYPALGRFFPTNAVHNEIMRDIRDFWGFQSAPMPLAILPEVLMATAGLVVVLGIAGALMAGRRALAAVSGIVLVAGLCVWSMPLTAGGWIYAMRVLLPCLALGAALSGWVAGLRPRLRLAVSLATLAVSVDGARRAWLLPDFPFSNPLTLSFSEWSAAHAESEGHAGGNLWAVLVKAAAGGSIMVDSPLPHVAINRLGGFATPFTSPQFAPAFDPTLSVEEAVRELRARHVRFVTFSVRNPVVNKLIRRHATLRRLADDYAPVANLNGLLIFDLDYLGPKAAMPAPKAPAAPH